MHLCMEVITAPKVCQYMTSRIATSFILTRFAQARQVTNMIANRVNWWKGVSCRVTIAKGAILYKSGRYSAIV